MNILISGGTGFIGKNLINFLMEDHNVFMLTRKKSFSSYNKGSQYFYFDGDIKNLRNFLIENNIKGIVHLASLYLKKHNENDILNLISSNILLGTQLLEASMGTRVLWFINTGTFWQHYQNSSYNPVNLYAASKQAFESMSMYYQETSKLCIVTLKLNDTYGPGDTRQKIINLWKNLILEGGELNMSKGGQLIDISYISDVCLAYLKLINLLSNSKNIGKFNGKQYCIKANERFTLKDLAQIFEKVTGHCLNINWGAIDYAPREVMIPWEGGEVVPGWKPEVSLELGIAKVMEME